MKIDLIVFGGDDIEWATTPGALATEPSRIIKIDNHAIGTFEGDPPTWKVDNFELAVAVGFGLIEGKGIGGIDRQVKTVFVGKVNELG